MTRFAFKTLFSDRAKLLAALTGVVFSLVLVNIQGGLYFGLIDRASLLINIAEADIWVGHRLVENVDLPKHIHQSLLLRIKGLPEVEQAQPYIVTGGTATLLNGGYEDLWIIGCDPGSWLGAPEFPTETKRVFSSADCISIDELDRPKLNHIDLGDVIEINGHRSKVVAKTNGLLSFMTTPNVFTTIDSARRYGGIPEGYCSYFLVKAVPGTDVDVLSQKIQQRLPTLDVFTAKEFSNKSRDYWMARTGIGISFGTSTVLGVLVGLVMVGQSLYALSLDHLLDYATLRAMGADNWTIFRVVMIQAITVALLGTVVGISLVLFIQQTWSDPMAPLIIPIELLLGSIALVFCLCFLGAMLPLRRVRKVDPMMVLQG